MSLQLNSSSELSPFPWNPSSLGMQPFSGFDSFGALSLPESASQMMYDPMMRRTMNNALSANKPMNPILYADIVDMGDRYEIHAGLYMFVILFLVL